MNTSFRRYEILLPRSFNDGQPIPYELIGQTVRELRQRFGAATCETQPLEGTWEHEGKTYQDDLVRVFVDVPDLPENLEFFRAFKEPMKARFQQMDIWMTTYPIEVL